MRILDSHFHYFPRAIFEQLNDRPTYPRAEPDGNGGYRYFRKAGAPPTLKPWKEWFDLGEELERMDATGHQVDVVSSLGPYSVHFSELPAAEGKEAAIIWNEAMAKAQRELPGRFWGTAAIPLVDTQIAIDVLDDAVNRLGLVGANLPGSVGADPRIDAERLEPFYARAAQLGVPLLLHPTDAVYPEMLGGYGGALYLTMGRVIEVSVGASRLIFSGIMERHPNLTIVMSHTGGALPYQAGRLDKNGKGAKLADKPSTYLKRMYTDTTSPHGIGIRFAIDFFGIDHVMYGDDYPCWDPDEALRCCDDAGIIEAERAPLFDQTARKLFKLRTPALSLSS